MNKKVIIGSIIITIIVILICIVGIFFIREKYMKEKFLKYLKINDIEYELNNGLIDQDTALKIVASDIKKNKKLNKMINSFGIKEVKIGKDKDDNWKPKLFFGGEENLWGTQKVYEEKEYWWIYIGIRDDSSKLIYERYYIDCYTGEILNIDIANFNVN